MNASKLLHAINPLGLAVAIALIVLWQWVVQSGLITISYLPAPTAVGAALAEQIASGEMGAAVSHTLWVALLAAAIAIAAGIILGGLLGVSPVARRYTLATVDFLRSIPAVALMPVALLLLGPAPESELAVGVYAALWPVLINTLGGVRGIDPKLSEVARTIQLSRGDEFGKIIIPSAVPSILVGARLSIVTALVVVIIAEMLVTPQGIGWALVAAQQSMRPDVLFAYAVVTGIIGMLLNVVLVRAARVLMPGSPVLREMQA